MIEPRLLDETQQPDRLKQPQGSDPIGIGGIFGGLEAHLHMALRGEIVDLVRLGLLDKANEIRGIGHIAIVKPEPHICLMGIAIEMIDASCIERRRAALDSVDGVAFIEQEFCEVSAVLASDAGDESNPTFAGPGIAHVRTPFRKHKSRTRL